MRPGPTVLIKTLKLSGDSQGLLRSYLRFNCVEQNCLNLDEAAGKDPFKMS